MSDRIIELYEKLGIPETAWPHYENPYDFSTQMKRCALTKNVLTTTSNSSAPYTNKKYN